MGTERKGQFLCEDNFRGGVKQLQPRELTHRFVRGGGRSLVIPYIHLKHGICIPKEINKDTCPSLGPSSNQLRARIQPAKKITAMNIPIMPPLGVFSHKWPYQRIFSQRATPQNDLKLHIATATRTERNFEVDLEVALRKFKKHDNVHSNPTCPQPRLPRKMSPYKKKGVHICARVQTYIHTYMYAGIFTFPFLPRPKCIRDFV